MRSSDIENLLRRAAVPELAYREIRAWERDHAASGGVRIASHPVRRRRAGPRTPWAVAVAAPVRGAGCTTVALNVACALAKRGWGISTDLRGRGASAPDLPPTLEEFAGAGPHLHGTVSDLSSVTPAVVRRVVADVDEVLVVLPPVISLSAVARLERFLDSAHAPARRFVVNGYDGRERDHRAGVAALRGALGTLLHAWQVPMDDAVRSAAAAQQPVWELDPASHAVAEFEALAGHIARAAEDCGRGGGAF